MRYPFYLRYLHEKTLPRLPLWYPGNPRTRLFLPLYWLKMVEHRKELPPDNVKFECHWQMSSCDVKEYLEKLYKIKVLDVRIEIEKGKYMDHPKRPRSLSPPMDDRKFAYVQLVEGTFKFPDILGEFDKKNNIDDEFRVIQNMQNKERNKNLKRFDISGWFA